MKRAYITPAVVTFNVEADQMLAASLTIKPGGTANDGDALVKGNNNSWEIPWQQDTAQ